MRLNNHCDYKITGMFHSDTYHFFIFYCHILILSTINLNILWSYIHSFCHQSKSSGINIKSFR